MATAVPMLFGSIQGAFGRGDVSIKYKNQGGCCANWACCVCGSGNSIEQDLTVVVIEQIKDDHDSKTSKIAECFKKLCCCCCGKKKKKYTPTVEEYNRWLVEQNGKNGRVVVESATMKFKVDPHAGLTVGSAGMILEELEKVKRLVKQLSYHYAVQKAELPEKRPSKQELIKEARRHLDIKVVHSNGDANVFASARIIRTLKEKVPTRRPLTGDEELIIVGGVKYQLRTMGITHITPPEIHKFVVQQLLAHKIELESPDWYDESDTKLPADLPKRGSFDELTSLECQALMGVRWTKH